MSIIFDMDYVVYPFVLPSRPTIFCRRKYFKCKIFDTMAQEYFVYYLTKIFSKS